MILMTNHHLHRRYFLLKKRFNNIHFNSNAEGCLIISLVDGHTLIPGTVYLTLNSNWLDLITSSVHLHSRNQDAKECFCFLMISCIRALKKKDNNLLVQLHSSIPEDDQFIFCWLKYYISHCRCSKLNMLGKISLAFGAWDDLTSCVW